MKSHTRTFFQAAALLGGLLLLVTTAAGAADGDWGVTLDLEASSRVEENEWSDAENSFTLGTALWTRTLIPTPDYPGGSLELATQLGYVYTNERPYLFDVDLFRLRGRYSTMIAGRSGLLEQTLGRYRLSDPSGRVINHLVDGLSYGVRYPMVNLNLTAATTAFQLNPSSNIRMTEKDAADADDSDELFGPARSIGMIEVGVPELIGAHGLRFALTAQQDHRSAEGDDETLDSAYYTLALAGPVVGGLYYDLSGTLMMAASTIEGETENSKGLMATARLRYFLESFLSSRAVASVVYASGDKDDNIARFRPISRGSAGTVFTQEIEDIVFAEFAYSLRPFSGMNTGTLGAVQTGISAKTFFKATEIDLPSEEIGIDEPGEGQWYGNEITLNITARLFSDLGLGITGGVFLPITDEDLGVFGKDAKPEYFGRIEVSTGF